MVDLEWLGPVALLRMRRPQARNALNLELLGALEDGLAQAGQARCLVLSGSDGVFCAGADLRERAGLSVEERTPHTRRIAALCDQIEAFPVPVVAWIEGPCLAGGLELALACDVRFGCEGSSFGFPEVGLGIFPGADGPLRLTRLLGPGRAARLLYSGAPVNFADALALGLVEVGDALVWAAAVSRVSSTAVRALKAALRASRDLPFVEAQAVVRQYREPLDASEEYSSALAAFQARGSKTSRNPKP